MTALPLSEDAARDLEEIGDYIARDRPIAAERVIEGLIALCYRIVENPLGYPACEHIRAGYRRGLHRSYVVLYRLTGAGVRIERIVHGARDLPALFADD